LLNSRLIRKIKKGIKEGRKVLLKTGHNRMNACLLPPGRKIFIKEETKMVYKIQ
jgi:hypothetical protein